MEKNSFILYGEFAEEIQLLSVEESGYLLKAIFAYEAGKEIPEEIRRPENSGAWVLFSIFKRRLDENRERYEAACKNKRKAGEKGGEASAAKRKASKTKQKQAPASSACSDASSAKQIQHDNDNDNDNDNEGQEIKDNPGAACAAGRTKAIAHESKAYQAAIYLDAQMRARMPTQKPADEKRLQSWAADFDKCHRLDGQSWEEIGRVLRFSQQDAFWQANILSGRKFREKYVQLLSKMQSQPSGPRNSVAYRNPGSKAAKSYDIEELEEMSHFDLPEGL